MKAIDKLLRDQAVRYVDGELAGAEKTSFESTLQNHTDLKELVKHLQLLSNTLKKEPLLEPSKNFTKLLMTRLEQSPSLTTSNISIKNSVMLLLGIFAVLVTAVALQASGFFDQTSTVDVNSIGFSNRVMKDLPSMKINGKWIVNIIIVLNLILAFVTIDRAVLKPLFQKRMEAGGL